MNLPVPGESGCDRPAEGWPAWLRAGDMPTLATALQARLAGDGISGACIVWALAADDPPHGSIDPVVRAEAGCLHALQPGQSTRLPSGRHATKLAGVGAAPWAGVLLDGGSPVSAGWSTALAAEVGPLLAHMLEIERLRQSVARLEQAERLQRALYQITEMASSPLDMPTMLAGLHRIVGGLMYAENFFIALYDADADSIRFIYFADTADEDWQDPEAVEPLAQIEGSLTWHLIRGAQPMMGPTERLYRELSGPLAVIGPGASDWLGVPIVIGGRVRGALVVQSYQHSDLYTAVERDLLTYVGTHIVTAIDRKHAFERLEQQAIELEREVAVRKQAEQRLQHEVLHDPLTGLPNRAYLREHLARAIATRRRNPSHRFAVLFLDLDRFKIINDSAGHIVGDELLKEVARRLSACLRPPDVVARLGGDEFAVVMHDIDGSDAPARLATRIIEAMREPVRVLGKALFTGASIGIAFDSPHYRAPEELLRDADIAMYRVKERRRGGFELFDETLHQRALELLALEGDLRLGASRGEFLPHFQPVVDIDDGAILGYEALMRWAHPTRGLVAPGMFLRAAEACGLLEALDWQLYDAVCARIPRLLHGDQFVHLNVSPRHFRSDDLDRRLLELLQRNGVQPRQVRIEITESALIDNPERTGACIDRLRDAGIRTALDDFGTGYSSMSYLQRFRFHAIKLDRSFIIDLDTPKAAVASALVRAVIDLSRALGLEVIAEGIETDAQRRALLALGCRIGQGYLFARPAPSDAFARPSGTPHA